MPWIQPAAPQAVLSTPDDRDGMPNESAGRECDDVTELSSFCSVFEPDVGMLPEP